MNHTPDQGNAYIEPASWGRYGFAFALDFAFFLGISFAVSSFSDFLAIEQAIGEPLAGMIELSGIALVLTTQILVCRGITVGVLLTGPIKAWSRGHPSRRSLILRAVIALPFIAVQIIVVGVYAMLRKFMDDDAPVNMPYDPVLGLWLCQPTEKPKETDASPRYGRRKSS